MYLTYGSYAHGIGECDISIGRTSEYNEAGQKWAIRERWDIRGFLSNPSGNLATMQTMTAALMNAYAYDGYDLILHLPTGGVTSHTLYSGSCLGGTRVVQPVSFPTGQGVEAVTYRSYTLAVEGLLTTGEATLLSYNENLSFSGGGPVYGHLETLTGRPVKQKLRNYSIYRVVQSGEAVGINSYPALNGPIWPQALVSNGGEERRSPKRYNDTYAEFPVSWRYEFESAYPLIGNPTRW